MTEADKAPPRKGIILAGGHGTRLHPLTKVISKQLLPVYDKPMIFYPMSTLMLAGIRDIAVISSPNALPSFRELLGDGSNWGVKLTYVEQANPNGIAEAFLLCEDHIKGHKSALVLGDNIFFGNGFTGLLREAGANTNGASIFSHRVSNPSDYCVVDVDDDHNAVRLVEKPKNPTSNLTVPGLYFYDERVLEIARTIKPSERGELEITSVNQEYLRLKALKIINLFRGFAWFDAGTIDSLMDASDFVRQIERRQGVKISCLEEIALQNGWIGTAELKSAVARLKDNAFSDYLNMLVSEAENRASRRLQ